MRSILYWIIEYDETQFYSHKFENDFLTIYLLLKLSQF